MNLTGFEPVDFPVKLVLKLPVPSAADGGYRPRVLPLIFLTFPKIRLGHLANLIDFPADGQYGWVPARPVTGSLIPC